MALELHSLLVAQRQANTETGAGMKHAGLEDVTSWELVDWEPNYSGARAGASRELVPR